MIPYTEATDKLIVSKEDLQFVETGAYICLEAIKPDCAQDDFSFPDGLVDRMVDAAYLRNEALNQAQRDAIDRVMPVLNYYSIIEYGPYAYAGYNGTEKGLSPLPIFVLRITIQVSDISNLLYNSFKTDLKFLITVFYDVNIIAQVPGFKIINNCSIIFFFAGVHYPQTIFHSASVKGDYTGVENKLGKIRGGVQTRLKQG